MRRGHHPRSRANLRPPWRPGESGNRRGRPRGGKSPERALLALLRSRDLQEEAERRLWAGVLRGERWAWSLVGGPPPLPRYVTADGYYLEPFEIALPPTPAWGEVAERLAELALRHPHRPPVALRRAVALPLAELDELHR